MRLVWLMVLTATALLASGTATTREAPGTELPEFPSIVTESAVGRIASFGRGVIAIEDSRTGRVRELRLAQRIRVTAHKKSALGGRKKLTAEDLAVGLFVRVTWIPERGVIEVRALEEKQRG